MDLKPALDLIKVSEGLKLTAYLCPAGIWTIGYGSTGPGIVKGTVWTLKQAEDDLLRRVTNEFVPIITKNVKVKISNNQLCALTSLVYNIGGANFKASSVLRCLNANDHAAAARHINDWNKARVNGVLTVLPGLVTRRMAEYKMFCRPDNA